MSSVVEIDDSDTEAELSFPNDLDQGSPATISLSMKSVRGESSRLGGMSYSSNVAGTSMGAGPSCHKGNGRSIKHITPAPTSMTIHERQSRHEVGTRNREIAEYRAVEADLPAGLLTVPLFKHQKIALAWMVRKENSLKFRGGILADDQGLGKTVSTIALILMLRSEQRRFSHSHSSFNQTQALIDIEEDEDGVVTFNKKGKLLKVDKTAQNINGEHQTDEKDRSETDGAHVVDDEEDRCGMDGTMDVDFSVETSSKKRSGRHMTYTSGTLSPAGGTLVVCPPSVLKQWEKEFADKVTDNADLSVLVYHGSSRTKDPWELASYDVVLTTYSIVSNEVPRSSLGGSDDVKQENKDSFGSPSHIPQSSKVKLGSRSKSKKKRTCLGDVDKGSFSGPLAHVRWFRIVLDEAQTIKNHRTQVAGACCGLRAKRRWCLSGTPIQNGVDDLFSYFCFLKIKSLSVHSIFVESIKVPISMDAELGYKKLQAILNTMLLRRTKCTIINGEPILNLPPKTVSLTTVEFSNDEKIFYLALEERTRQQFKAYAAAGTVKQNYASILVMLLRLRQACDHPLLARERESNSIEINSVEMARKLPRATMMNMLAKLDSSAICTLCTEPPEDAVAATCGHIFCHQCISAQLDGSDDVCPYSGCNEILSMKSIFSKAALRICASHNSNRAASTIDGLCDMSICQNTYISSKIQAAMNIINSMCASNNSQAKAIVFSQWTSMLDLVELRLTLYMYPFRRLDGKMTLNARDKAIRDFNTDPEIRVMLMSLKAGSLGLNMVAACHVILLDLWWNPFAEDQAVDRAHRIGQTRPVTVSRLAVKDTVEDRILALQDEKRKVVNSALGENMGSARATRLSVEDLRYLFRI